jgi:hypothetical protein
MIRRFGLKLSALLGLVAIGVLAVTGMATAQHPSGKQHHHAKLKAVPHDPVADAGSNVRGTAKIQLRGTNAKIHVKARGLTPKLPHAMHIHGKDNPEVAFCPGGDRRDDLVNDGLIETVEGLADYGGIQVSLTRRGDTSPASGLALDRFQNARRNGTLNYKRAFDLPHAVAERLEDKHIVIHGADLDRDGKYGGRTTALGAPLEAELPVACGELIRTR